MRRRRKRPQLLLLLRLLLASTLPLASVVRCFNLDVRIPVIKTGGAHGESFFGYAVAQHRTAATKARGGSGGAGEAMVLVGAPQDENLQPGTTRSGALWKCAWNNDIQVSPAAEAALGFSCVIYCITMISRHDNHHSSGLSPSLSPAKRRQSLITHAHDR